jgi:hypothetical protein
MEPLQNHDAHSSPLERFSEIKRGRAGLQAAPVNRDTPWRCLQKLSSTEGVNQDSLHWSVTEAQG